MSVLLMVIGFVLATSIMSAVTGVFVYNRLVKLRHRYENGYAQVGVQLQRRYDLIPNLVEAAKGYLAHEQDTLKVVSLARNDAVAALAHARQHPDDITALARVQRAEQAVTKGLQQFRTVMEAHPHLAADATITRVMEELTSTENRIAFARQAYNDFVMRYNTSRERIPNIMYAYLFGFDPARHLQLEAPETRQAPLISFE